jgi:hypothetical protein
MKPAEETLKLRISLAYICIVGTRGTGDGSRVEAHRAESWPDPPATAQPRPKEAIVSDRPLGAGSALTEHEAFLARRILWGVLLTPLAGSFGAALLLAARPEFPREALVLSGWGWILGTLFFAGPIFGGMFAAPVTLAVLPIARGRLPGRDKKSLFLLALIGLLSGFLSPVLLILAFTFDKAFALGPSALTFAGMGAGSGFIVAILYFLLTDGERRVWLRSTCIGLLLLPVAVFGGASLKNRIEEPKEPPALGDLRLHDLIRKKPIPAALREIAIDPNGSAPFTLVHRPDDSWTPPFEAKITVPPRLLHDFYVRWTSEDGAIAVSAMRLEALLPDLALRSPANLDAFPDGAVLDGYDVLDVTLAYVQQLGPFPDDWFRRKVRCKDANLEPDPDFDGLEREPEPPPRRLGDRHLGGVPIRGRVAGRTRAARLLHEGRVHQGVDDLHGGAGAAVAALWAGDGRAARAASVRAARL